MSQKASHSDPGANDAPLLHGLGAVAERIPRDDSGLSDTVNHPLDSLERPVAPEGRLDCVSGCISKQIGWLAAPLLLILALAPLFVTLFVLCGLFASVSQRIATLDPTTTSVEEMPESLRSAVIAPTSVARRLISVWLSALSTLILLLHTAGVMLYWSLAKICLVHCLSLIQTRIRRAC